MVTRTKNQPKNQAVSYIRMSTEHQEFSPDLQRCFIENYAKENGLEIIREYIDEGKSGLTAEHRPQFLSMIQLVQSGQADFDHILVYDVSRWGRFMNIDESGHYELICTYQGIKVHYCAEPFKGNDIASQIYKTMKRLSVGDYCRELGVKVFNGQKNLIQHGFRQGGVAGFGLRRRLIDCQGNPKFDLQRGDRKSLQTDRVILVAGPKEEQEIVRQIYHDFVYQHKTEQQIADSLNAQGIVTDRNTAWTKGVVHQILINEKYVGHNVWNKRSASKTREYKGKNPVEEWVRAENVFEAIVPQALFNAAQTIIHQRSARLSDDEMLEQLKLLLKEKGKLSGLIIDEAENCPSSSAYSSRFGSLLNTYTLINYEPERDYHYVEINRLLRQQHKNFVQQTLDTIIELGGVVLSDDVTDLVHINNEFTASIVLSRCRLTPSGSKRWLIRFDTSLNPDITIAVRINESATEILDYYLLPTTEKVNEKLRLAESNPAELEIYRHDNLDRFFIMVERILVKEFIYAKRHHSNSSYRQNSGTQSQNAQSESLC
ncbi:TPA: recombinase family protein [Mannheimia haemolytica]|uniref:Recombinase family protein n=2 Tax=Mannheimia haemolytica TaxID=75985 RepID=A0A547EGV0_MANHA|nr:recombinase family protein [Mannheimia haemolytica]AGI33801.1 recombinase family protein [Mannheimia haemolytica USDA-ARS-USMARC-183]AGQ25671.1 serine recombinase [Mannheimia haemolytica D153]AWW72476.1 recombinase family protein [Pasteurellaceae bacterium 12565]AGI34286.1 recombinase family protein [Mannheimia haemolytica USDA-ARS-USMARC-185]AGK01284.1 site-specific recombinase [Mannheimia haemolytica M42548]